MKILHICLASFYIDDYSYQENMLPKYHKKLGMDVEILASLVSFDENGKSCLLKNSGRYINEYNIPVTRLDYKKSKVSKRLRQYVGTYEAIVKARPDVIFVHGCQFVDIKHVVRYVKQNPSVKVYIDNHADYSNSATNWFSKNILHKIIWKKCAQLIEPYTIKFYGVLPARVEFLVDIYGLPSNKVELLVMGADDEKVVEANNNEVKKEIRDKYNILEDDFLIMTGGKIDAFKKQTLHLMSAVKEIKDERIKLIIFGSVTEELKSQVESLCDGIKIQYIGWLPAVDSYKFFASSDLVVFPGRHSVFWEQVAGQGIPMIVKKWNGTTHIDLGGNVTFLLSSTSEEISNKIMEIYLDKLLYKKMIKAAHEGLSFFSYRDIARRSIGICENNEFNYNHSK